MPFASPEKRQLEVVGVVPHHNSIGASVAFRDTRRRRVQHRGLRYGLARGLVPEVDSATAIAVKSQRNGKVIPAVLGCKLAVVPPPLREVCQVWPGHEAYPEVHVVVTVPPPQRPQLKAEGARAQWPVREDICHWEHLLIDEDRWSPTLLYEAALCMTIPRFQATEADVHPASEQVVWQVCRKNGSEERFVHVDIVKQQCQRSPGAHSHLQRLAAEALPPAVEPHSPSTSPQHVRLQLQDTAVIQPAAVILRGAAAERGARAQRGQVGSKIKHLGAAKPRLPSLA